MTFNFISAGSVIEAVLMILPSIALIVLGRRVGVTMESTE